MRSYVVLTTFAATLSSAVALAQPASDAGVAAVAPVPTAGDLSAHDAALKAQLLKEVQAGDDQRLQKMRDELRSELKDEIRAEMTTAQAPPQEFEELPEEKPKLQFFEVNGYFRVRPSLFENMQLGWTQPDQLGFYLFPKALSSPDAKTVETADMRFRIEPTLNVSEDIRIKAQIDVLDNVVLGSNPELSSSTPLTVLSQSQVPPSSANGNLAQQAIQAKRVWAEVAIPVIGQLRFGRMGNQWGLGMYQNDGNCLDCDYGNTVDRIMLVLKIANHYIIPMIDWVGSGPLYNSAAGDQLGQPVSFDKSLEAYQYGIQVARRDSDKELKALEEQGKPSINYGFYGTIRQQSSDLMWNGAGGYNAVTSSTPSCASAGNPGGVGVAPCGYNSSVYNTVVNGVNPTLTGVEGRNATFYVPDVWARYKTKRLRLEAEAVYVNGNFTINDEQVGGSDPNNVDHKINVSSFGGAFQGEYKFLSDLQLTVGLDSGLATGNHSYGFGAQPGRTSPFGAPLPQGSIDGNPISCATATEPCLQNTVNAFSFSPDYRVDQILWRQLLGTVTDAWFVKPSIKYRFFPGLEASFSSIYSGSMMSWGTPGGSPYLGLEFDAGIHYQTDDGFIANLDYGLLVPLPGLSEVVGSTTIGTSIAQAARLLLGVKY